MNIIKKKLTMKVIGRSLLCLFALAHCSNVGTYGMNLFRSKEQRLQNLEMEVNDQKEKVKKLEGIVKLKAFKDINTEIGALKKSIESKKGENLAEEAWKPEERVLDEKKDELNRLEGELSELVEQFGLKKEEDDESKQSDYDLMVQHLQEDKHYKKKYKNNKKSLAKAKKKLKELENDLISLQRDVAARDKNKMAVDVILKVLRQSDLDSDGESDGKVDQREKYRRFSLRAYLDKVLNNYEDIQGAVIKASIDALKEQDSSYQHIDLSLQNTKLYYSKDRKEDANKKGQLSFEPFRGEDRNLSQLAAEYSDKCAKFGKEAKKCTFTLRLVQQKKQDDTSSDDVRLPEQEPRLDERIRKTYSVFQGNLEELGIKDIDQEGDKEDTTVDNQDTPEEQDNAHGNWLSKNWKGIAVVAVVGTIVVLVGYKLLSSKKPKRSARKGKRNKRKS